MTMKIHGVVKHGLPALLLLGVVQDLVPAQTGDPVIDYIGIVVPYIGEFLNFMRGILVPIGTVVGETVIAPIVAIIPQNDPAGFAIYFIIFAGLFMISMLLNTMWRPRGYKETKKKKKNTTELVAGIEPAPASMDDVGPGVVTAGDDDPARDA